MVGGMSGGGGGYKGERLSWEGVAGYYSLARLLVVTMDEKVRSYATTL